VRQAVLATGRSTVRGYGCLTSRWRPYPDFLVIGAKRGGSTSFYYDLLRHSRICPLFPRPEHLPKAAATKGVHFFDVNFGRGERWYRSHMPSTFVRDRMSRQRGGSVIVGEASPYYLFHPAAAERAARVVPNAKIIVLLRDPVQRTYSHWKERRRNGVEPLSFADALRAEDERIGDVEARLCADPGFHSYPHEQLSYARQSEYDAALRRWYDRFPADRILPLASEDYYARPDDVLGRAAEFLGLPRERLATGAVRNAAAGADLDPRLTEELAQRFADSIRRTVELTGRTYPWS
jgi:hypothetical protein